MNLDSTLTLSSHIEKTTGKFRQRVILLSYMAKYLSPSIIDRLYKGYVRPVAEYASPLWQPRTRGTYIRAATGTSCPTVPVPERCYSSWPHAEGGDLPAGQLAQLVVEAAHP